MADKRLQAFHAVARLLSFTRAADSLQMTQPAVTFQIKQLEEQLNVRLFDRSHNRISLTEAGRRAFDYSERIFGLYGEMESAIREVTGDVSGVLRIAVGNAMAQYILTPVLTAFSQQFPAVQIRLDVCSCAQAVSMVENSFADIGVIETTTVSKKLSREVHSEMSWRFVAAPGHPLARAQNITAQMLEQQTWIMAHETADAHQIVRQYIQDIGIEPTRLRVMMEMGSMAMIKHAVEAGQGVAILPQAAITKELKLGTLVSPPLAQLLIKPISFIYKQQKFPLKVVDELLNLTREAKAGKKVIPAHTEAIV
jgi:DNA-binding transcriptional LysR family regulator